MNSVLARFLPGHADGDVAAVREQKEHLDRQQVTFPDLTWDHFHWERQRRTGHCDRPKAASRYRRREPRSRPGTARSSASTGRSWSRPGSR